MMKLSNLYVQSKVWFNRFLDRLIDQANNVLMDVYGLPWTKAQGPYRLARGIGDVSWLLRDFPRLSAYKLVGTHWTIIFVGSEHSLLEINHLFFTQEEVNPEMIGRVALSRLSAQSQQWLAEGVDLVVYELSCVQPRPPYAPITFTVPVWVQQVLDIPESLETLVTGKRIKGLINRFQKAGYEYRFSQAKADFDHFYYQMYLPFVKKRHDELALVASYQDHWRWFTKGGLILITSGNKTIAGMICYMAGDICYPIEGGIIEADQHLWQQGINAFLFWCCILWGREHGAKIFDMGGSHGWFSDGPFTFKRRWGARVIKRRRIHAELTFLAKNLSPSLQNHLNELGLISEIGGKFYGVWLNNCPTTFDQAKIQSNLLAAQGQGLAGSVVITPNTKPIICAAGGRHELGYIMS